MRNKVNLYYLVGPSYSGKSTWALARQQDLNAVIVSSDKIREELWGDENIQREPSKVFGEMHKRTFKLLSEGQNVIYDATNLKAEHRCAFLDHIRKLDVNKICVLFTPDFDELISRQKMRSRFVSAQVIERQIRSFDPPYYGEGWDTITSMTNPREGCNLEDFLQDNYDEPHDNPHHSLSIGEHMEKCFELYEALPPNILKHHSGSVAARYHDIGKFFTKTFTNSKGETTNVAHYYDHEKVGSYFICNYYRHPDWLMVAVLVRYHMAPYYCGEKKLNKIKKILGNHLYSVLVSVHECDRQAH